jgi:type IV secretion system protein VirB1
MDLITLVTACSLGVDPKVMHALVWHQSGGEPWAVSIANDPMPRPQQDLREAINEARAISTDVGVVRIGLAGVPTAPSQVNAMFLPCQNVQLAVGRIATRIARCKERANPEPDPITCALAAYRGSWNEPDIKFALAAMASVAKGDAPNFDMPKNTKLELLEVASETPPQPENAASPGFAVASDDRERGWSSALFPTKELQRVEPSNSAMSDTSASAELQSLRATKPNPSATKLPENSLFVPRSSGLRPQ